MGDPPDLVLVALTYKTICSCGQAVQGTGPEQQHPAGHVLASGLHGQEAQLGCPLQLLPAQPGCRVPAQGEGGVSVT